MQGPKADGAQPATAGGQATEGYLGVPGGRVWYRVTGAGRPGIPLLCLHGGPGMPHDYLEPLADLAADRPVVFYDQLGCGRSDRPDDESLWTLDRFVEELAVVRDALGLERTHLFGNSWGGWLALQYALDRRPALESLVLSSSPPSVARWIADCAKLRADLDEPVREVLDRHEASGYFSCPEYQWAVTQFYRRHLCRADPWPDCVQRTFAGMGAGVYQAMWGPSEFGPVTGRLRGWDVTARLAEIAVPTLATGGRFDEARPAHMAVLADGIPGAQLAIFEQSSHLAFVEERDGYLAVLRDFLARGRRPRLRRPRGPAAPAEAPARPSGLRRWLRRWLRRNPGRPGGAHGRQGSRLAERSLAVSGAGGLPC